MSRKDAAAHYAKLKSTSDDAWRATEQEGEQSTNWENRPEHAEGRGGP